MSVGGILSRVRDFFKETTGAIVGAYFDGERLFVVQLTEKFETVEVEADGSEFEQIAAQIAQICRRKDWSTSAIGFCLRAEDAVIFQTEVGNVPAKEIPALVKSWATAQAGAEAVFSSATVGAELWMETLPRIKVEEICAAFKRNGLNLRALSVMPDAAANVHPYDRTEFISEVVRDKKPPNLLARGGVWSWKKLSLATAAIFLGVMIILSAKLFADYGAAADNLDAAKLAVENLRGNLAIKQAVDADIAELRRINALAAQIDDPDNFSLLLKVGKLADRSIHLTSLRVDEKTLELEGTATAPAAIRNYLARMKSSVAATARLESSSEHDGEIAFTIRASL